MIQNSLLIQAADLTTRLIDVLQKLSNTRDSGKWILSLVIILIAAEDAVEARKRLDQNVSSCADEEILAMQLLDAYEGGDANALEEVLNSRALKYLDQEVAKLVVGIRTGGGGGVIQEDGEDFC